MAEVFTGRTFFFVGKAAAHRDFNDVPPLDPRSYILQPGARPIKDPNEPHPKVLEAVEKAVEQMGGLNGLQD